MCYEINIVIKEDNFKELITKLNLNHIYGTFFVKYFLKMTTKHNHKHSCLYTDKRYANRSEIEGDFSDFKKWHENLHQLNYFNYIYDSYYLLLAICISMF